METTWDPAKARVNVARHGVAFEDAELALSDSAGLTREDPDARAEARFVTVGADAPEGSSRWPTPTVATTSG